MPIFLSHRTTDDAKARTIFNYLISRGVPCYLDDVDPTLLKSQQITSQLVKRINLCTHLMALITRNTRESWWVPFEIGVARQAARRITSYKGEPIDLPEYLTEWPILEGNPGLDAFIRQYRSDVSTHGLTGGMIKTASMELSADQFHKNLKAELRQF